MLRFPSSKLQLRCLPLHAMLYIFYCCDNHKENLTQWIGFSQLFIVFQFLFWVANDVSLSQPKQKYPLELTIIDT